MGNSGSTVDDAVGDVVGILVGGAVDDASIIAIIPKSWLY